MEKLTKQQFRERFHDITVFKEGKEREIMAQFAKAGIKERDSEGSGRGENAFLYTYGSIENMAFNDGGDYIYDYLENSCSKILGEEKYRRIVKAEDILNVEIIEDEKPKCDFKPFDKVLVRNFISMAWKIDLFERYTEGKNCPYLCLAANWWQCIPYEGNEHLLGTTDEPKED